MFCSKFYQLHIVSIQRGSIQFSMIVTISFQKRFDHFKSLACDNKTQQFHKTCNAILCFFSLSFLLILFNDIIAAQVHAELDLNGLSACEQEQIARQIFYPKNGYEMHVSNP